MSVRVMAAVWDMELPDSEKLIMLALADWSNDEAQCWPSVGQLARKCSKSERTVQGALKALEAKGALSRIMTPGKGTLYTLHPRNGCTPADTAPPQGTTQTPAAAAPNTLVYVNRDTIVSPPLTPQKPKADASKPEKAKAAGKSAAGRAAAGAKVPAVPEWVPPDAWAGFVEMRKGKGKPLTARAVELIVAKLKGLADAGHPPGAVLDQSTMNGWQGVFKPKGDDYGGRSGGGGSRKRSDAERWPGGIRDPVLRDLAGRGSGLMGGDPA